MSDKLNSVDKLQITIDFAIQMQKIAQVTNSNPLTTLEHVPLQLDLFAYVLSILIVFPSAVYIIQALPS